MTLALVFYAGSVLAIAGGGLLAEEVDNEGLGWLALVVGCALFACFAVRLIEL